MVENVQEPRDREQHESGDGLERLERTTTSGDVTKILRRRILEGRYGEEQFIRQDVIASELGVSRIPVREALAQLETEGLIVRVKYRGAIVPRLSIEELEEIYELRGLIEPYLLKHSIIRINGSELKNLHEIVDRSSASETMADWADLNVEFHRTLFSAARKPLAMQVLDNLLVRADRYLKLQNFRSPTTKEESDAEHRRILELVEQKDIDGAMAALKEHIAWNAEDVRGSLPDRIPRSN